MKTTKINEIVNKIHNEFINNKLTYQERMQIIAKLREKTTIDFYS